MAAALQDRKQLERQIQELKSQLEDKCKALQELSEVSVHEQAISVPTAPQPSIRPDVNLHTLLLLADSALPLGSFAFSSGLESCLAHSKASKHGESPRAVFQRFLSLSLHSLASTALPYVMAAYREPARLVQLDNDFDASTPCGVARRASIAQGKAFLAVWERSFKTHYEVDADVGLQQLRLFADTVKTAAGTSYSVSAHLAPLWGAITLALGLSLHASAYMFLFSHARTLVSAAVRASVVGPYQAQAILADSSLNGIIDTLMKEQWEVRTENAGQTVPAMDIWMGRHELLYSRIFNS